MNDNDPINAFVTTLRPDALTEDSYRRRRSADLTRAFRTPRTHQHTRRFSMAQRRSLFLIAGTAAAGLAAAAFAVPQLVSGDSPARSPIAAQDPGVRPPAVDAAGEPTADASSARRTVNARTSLLAAAKVAAKEPIDSGRFWYSRVRTGQRVRVVPGDYMAKIKGLMAEYEAKKKELKGKPAELKAALKEIDKRVLELKTAKLPYIATKGDTTESWRSLKDADGRTVSNQDVKVEFATPEDEAKWKQAGSPRLFEDDKPRTKQGVPETIVSIGNDGLTWTNLSKLPTDKEQLKAKLKSLYDQSPQKKDKSQDFADYIWGTGADLLTAPITPGTRAALYHVLADPSLGLKSQAGVTDGQGRSGVALETTGPNDAGEPDKITYRLIFDDKTAKVLELDVIESGDSVPLLRQTFESAGYVDSLGDKPSQ
ncbi:hypothetical protein [Nonomuraea lactucae]|uniref:hypothetical protein n=1 Tax=Nonomuraea lactucae TaxID=2249762 RepID=UPI000DE2F3B9|nr:hypothetical protein [Nonomuraea lactucae]